MDNLSRKYNLEIDSLYQALSEIIKCKEASYCLHLDRKNKSKKDRSILDIPKLDILPYS